MTRDEAINKAIAIRAPYGNRDAGFRELIARDIDVFVTLGILKLDEPKAPLGRFWEQVKKEGHSVYTADATLDLISRAGLKIVEK